MTIPSRSWAQHLIRGILALAVALTPIGGSMFVLPVFPIVFGVLLAYEGLDDGVVAWSVMVIVIVELIWGIDIGVLSLSYIVSALAMRFTEGFITIVPLSRDREWSLPAFIRSTIIAWLLVLIMMIGSTVIQAYVHHQGTVRLLMVSSFYPLADVLGMTAALVILGLVILHRIDTPFRQPMKFGTF